LDTRSLCPCGSGVDYSQCCHPYHSGEKLPLTAEALMRSRFSAYALDNTTYIVSTWAGSVKPEKIDFSKEPIEWTHLEIIGAKKGGVKDSKGIVEFKAFYTQNNEELALYETSRFIKTNGRWLYLDGVVKSVGKIIPQSNEGKNAPCSCGSGKKYKRCCGAA
jgi:SEC-C motif domain protein